MNGENKKLEIIIGTLQGNKANFSTSNSIIVAFNPTEYTVEKSNGFAEATVPGLDSPLIQFSSGKSRSLTLELLLDTYSYGKQEDLRKTYMEKFEKLVAVDGDIHAPPPCKVVWGTMEFIGFVESLSKKYVMFLGDGTPVRARVNLKFKEYIPVDIQLKKTKRASPDKRKVHLVKEGDSLWQLAYNAYGDPKLWRILADANEIQNPQILIGGTSLTIPALSPELLTRGGHV